MATFTIDSDNSITAYATAGDVLAGATDIAVFDSQAALAKAAADWPRTRLVEVWNSIPGQKPVTKFQDRKKAAARIWAAIQPLADAPATPKPKAGKANAKPKKAAKAPKKASKATPASIERTNKKAEVIAMMKRSKGATLAEIMEHTGWTPRPM